jgi:hypothetical protein
LFFIHPRSNERAGDKLQPQQQPKPSVIILQAGWIYADGASEMLRIATLSFAYLLAMVVYAAAYSFVPM